MPSTIEVFADWDGLQQPSLLGLLHPRRGGGREVFEFEFAAGSLDDPMLANLHLDPRIGSFGGRQHPPQGRKNFGVFADASPDRWGRLLMQRRLERDQRAGLIDEHIRLHESDYLLGVEDSFRVGALRFRRQSSAGFSEHRPSVAAPPFVQLRELEAASRAIETDLTNTAAGGDHWLRMLIAPGGSLGGARPKATVGDPSGGLWIAKFPSVRDEFDVGAWELVVHTLARASGLRVPESQAARFANPHHTFLVQRFDRTARGNRLHYASAMTLADHVDGDDASTGASYLEIARVLIDHGAQTDVDLRELWSRIVFNVLVSNADDHLRNHGFILMPGKGWRLSAAFDMNPVAGAHGLSLNISLSDNALDLDLARSVAHFFRVGAVAAEAIIDRTRHVVRQWPRIASGLGLTSREQEQMASAFRIVG